MKKMELLEKAKKVKYVFDKMDSETQEAVKSLINHLMVAKTKNTPASTILAISINQAPSFAAAAALAAFLGRFVRSLSARFANSASTASWCTDGNTLVLLASNHRSCRENPDMPSYSLVIKKEVKPHASMQSPQNMQRPKSILPDTI